MRIIAGKYKGKKISFPDDVNFRPTKGKTKEAIFSMLDSGKFLNEKGEAIINGAIVLDLFAGSGAYSFESLSRGAKEAIFVEIEQDNIKLIKENASNIDPDLALTYIRADASKLPKSQVKCNIVFIDPPYKSDLINKTLISLHNQEWLENNAIIIAEVSKFEANELPEIYKLIDERNYGKTKLLVLEYGNLS